MKFHEQPQQLSTLIQGADASIVQVLARARLPASGVVWSSEGDHALLLTANHAIEHGHSLRVTLADGKRIAASIVGRDPKNDLALLQIPRAAQAADWGRRCRSAAGRRNRAGGRAAFWLSRSIAWHHPRPGYRPIKKRWRGTQ